jgi:DNA-binding transcriptional LysR family regulator
MRRPVNLRQIEAFKALIENGTITRAAELLHISQPAMSKLIANLEHDTELTLFDRVKGRLVPTERAMRLHEEVDRIFAGVRQVDNAVDAIRREEKGWLEIGVMPALASAFVRRTTTAFLGGFENVFCSVHSLSSPIILDRLTARKLDIGLIGGGFENPYIVLDSLMEHPLVCVMSLDHPLSQKEYIEPQDLDGIPFVSFNSDGYIRHCVEESLETYSVKPRITLEANMAPTLCEYVAAGFGVSLLHPLLVAGHEDALAVRRFEPDIIYGFQICRNDDGKNRDLVDGFAQHVRETAAEVCSSIIQKT